MKQISIAAVNKRMNQIGAYFGTSSEVYLRAQNFIKGNVKDEFIKTDAAGNILGIRQTKEAKNAAKLYMRPEALDEYVPSLTKLFTEERAVLVDEIQNRSNTFIGPDLQAEAIKKMSHQKIMQDANLSRYFTNRIESVYHDLNNQTDIVLEVYDVRDNKQGLNDADYAAGNFHAEALQLIDELHAGLGRNRDWMRRARSLVDRYYAKINEQIKAEIEKKKGKR